MLETDEETKKTLTIIRAQLDLGKEMVEDVIKWEDAMPVSVDIDTIFDKTNLYTSSFHQYKSPPFNFLRMCNPFIIELYACSTALWNRMVHIKGVAKKTPVLKFVSFQEI